MGARALHVVLSVIVALQVAEWSQALNPKDQGVCYNPVTVSKTTYERFNRSRKRCPAGYKLCSYAEGAKNLPHFNSGSQICCSKKQTVHEKILGCCSKWVYHKEDETCRAQCRKGCGNGRCTAPDHCECDPHLTLIDNKCVPPICDHPCVNSHCVLNNICVCESGFSIYNKTHCAPSCHRGYYNDLTTLQCIPKCDSPCRNGTCSGPNECTCFEGFEALDNFTCIPQCSPACENATCVASNTCSCLEGYRNISSTTCIPVCKSGCNNGECIRPNECACHEGYEMKNGVCTPVCQQPCINGICSAPNFCTCNNGYEVDLGNIFNCLPICNTTCENATCIAPDRCDCLIGFQPTERSWACKPTCGICEHGDCIGPNKCNCHDGYTMQNGTCQPICGETCVNGFCSAPNTCTCNDGYESDKDDVFRCHPKCNDDCVNATCIAPNECSCLDGYIRTYRKNVCQPKCDSCRHGECIAPNICRCNDAYEKVDGECSPICFVPCVNANCTSPNVCTCKEGYQKERTSTSICHRPCQGPCDHGICSLDGECRCDDGYELHNETCMPYISCTSCEYSCEAGQCWCKDGRRCEEPGAKAESTTGLAGVELTWTLAGAVIVLLTVFIMVVMHRLYRKRKECETEDMDDGNRAGSVVYTLPDGLLQKNHDKDCETEDERRTNRLLSPAYKDEEL